MAADSLPPQHVTRCHSTLQILELELWDPKGLVGSPEMEGRIFERMSFLGSFLGISLFADDDVSGNWAKQEQIS